MAGALSNLTIIIGSLFLAGIPFAALLYLDFRRQCRAADEAAKLYAAHHLARSPS